MDYKHLRRLYFDIDLYEGLIIDRSSQDLKSCIHYIEKVIRLTSGEEIRVFNHKAEYLVKYDNFKLNIIKLLRFNSLLLDLDNSFCILNPDCRLSQDLETDTHKTNLETDTHKTNLGTNLESNSNSILSSNPSLKNVFTSDYQCTLGATPKINLWIGMLKLSNFSDAIQMLSQFEVANIYPIYTERVQLSKKDAKNLNLKRYREIAITSTEQSEKFEPTKVHDIMDLNTMIAQHNKEDSTKLIIACDENRSNLAALKCISQHTNLRQYSEITIIIGPEGGFSVKESEIINSIPGVLYLSFTNILKSQVASVSAVAIIEFLLTSQLH